VATSAIAIALTRAERRLIDHLLRAGATSPATAAPLPELRGIEEGRLDRFLSAGVIREPVPGSYYVDETVYATFRRDRRFLILGVVGALLVALLVVFLL
jgi:hypothetical protein